MENGTLLQEVLLDHVLPPPIYSNCLTTRPERATKQIKLVRDIRTVTLGVQIEGAGGETYIASWASIKYMVVSKHDGE